MGDPELLNGVMSGQLTPEQNTKMINWMVDNDDYRKQILDGMAQDPNSAWVNNLSEDKKKKMLKITLDKSSKGNILNPSNEMSEEDGKALVEAYFEDPEIGATLLRANPDVQNAMKDHDFVERLKKALPEINFDQEQLSDADLIKAYKYVMEHPEILPGGGQHHLRIFYRPRRRSSPRTTRRTTRRIRRSSRSPSRRIRRVRRTM